MQGAWKFPLGTTERTEKNNSSWIPKRGEDTGQTTVPKIRETNRQQGVMLTRVLG